MILYSLVSSPSPSKTSLNSSRIALLGDDIVSERTSQSCKVTIPSMILVLSDTMGWYSPLITLKVNVCVLHLYSKIYLSCPVKDLYNLIGSKLHSDPVSTRNRTWFPDFLVLTNMSTNALLTLGRESSSTVQISYDSSFSESSSPTVATNLVRQRDW